MVDSRIQKYALVECNVLGHQPYGLVLQLRSGMRGFVDKTDIADEVIGKEDWPRIGEFVRCVVLGFARDGRFRASSRPRDVAFVSAVRDPRSAISTWIRLRDEGFIDRSDKVSFFESSNAVPTLRWALLHDAGSCDRIRASEILEDAPEDIVREVRE